MHLLHRLLSMLNENFRKHHLASKLKFYRRYLCWKYIIIFISTSFPNLIQLLFHKPAEIVGAAAKINYLFKATSSRDTDKIQKSIQV